MLRYFVKSEVNLCYLYVIKISEGSHFVTRLFFEINIEAKDHNAEDMKKQLLGKKLNIIKFFPFFYLFDQSNDYISVETTSFSFGNKRYEERKSILKSRHCLIYLNY